jgi:CheY-like chemotaxis protein
MPNMDGIEFIGVVRNDPQYRDMPIIMLTTDSSPRTGGSPSDRPNLYMVKPSPALIILFKVRSLLDADK